MERELSVKTANTASASAAKVTVSVLGLVIFITGILYYCNAYLLRVFPSIMENDLLHHFGITASSFGLLTSLYYFAYAPMQLPVGVVVDKYGARRSLLFASSICILGVYVFAASHQLGIAMIGRFLIGFGSAFAYVTALKLATLWLPRKYFATATGFVTGAGMLAAALTDISLTRFEQSAGHMATMHLILGISILLFFLIFLIIKDKPRNNSATTTPSEEPEEAHALSYRQLGNYLRTIARNPQMWIIGIVGALLYLPASVFLDVWGIPYLKTVYHLTAEDAAYGVTLVLIGWIVSTFVVGALSDTLGTRKKPLLLASFCSATLASIIFFVPNIPKDILFILLFFFGVACGPHPLCFTLSKENNTFKISGTAIAFANFLIMMGGFIFQPVVGKILDWDWSGTIAHGIRVYTAGDYRLALGILPIGLVIAFLLTLTIKETYQQPKPPLS